MIKFQSFLSGSSGNCTFLTNDSTKILVDCGATGKYITDCLGRLGISPDSIDAILVTHEHRDHTSGVGVMSRKFQIPVYATAPTWEGMDAIVGGIQEENRKVVPANEDFAIKDLVIRPFDIPHDANNPVGYSFTDHDHKFTIATDIGHISDELLENLRGSEYIIIEANHDIEMLRTGRYPYYLKRRILGDRGHLSNDMCGRLCAMLAKEGTRAFWLGHLSKENNIPQLAYDTVNSILKEQKICVGSDVGLSVIPRYWLR